jgi:hypothetical protein
MRKRMWFEKALKTRRCINCERVVASGEYCLAFYYEAASNSVSGSLCCTCLFDQIRSALEGNK